MVDRNYRYPYVDIVEVMRNMDVYIIPENREAIKMLWDKNIFTSMTNNYDDNYSWINFRGLSEVNEKILWNMAKYDKRFGYVGHGYGIAVSIIPKVGNDTTEAFRELIDMFEWQDVQRMYYMSEEEFMINCTSCYKIVRNPLKKLVSKPKKKEFSNPVDYAKAYEEYASSMNVPMFLKVLDESKMNGSISSYIDSSKYCNCYDKEEGKIFLSEELYQRHIRYKRMIKVKRKSI